MIRTRIRGATILAGALMLAAVAGPAVAQPVPEGFVDAAQCETAVRQIVNRVDVDNISDTLRARIEALIARGDAPYICTIYIPTNIDVPPEVLPNPPVDRPSPPVQPGRPGEPGRPGTEVGGVVVDRPTPPSAPGSPTSPTEVLGRSLARTGSDAGILALIGAGILGLGLVAVRRTRQTEPR